MDLLSRRTLSDKPNQSNNSSTKQKANNEPNNARLSKSLSNFDKEINNKG